MPMGITLSCMPTVTVLWTGADGGEHEETWASIDAFLAWAAGEGLRGEWRAYQTDEDGDLIQIGRGRFGSSASSLRKAP